jgi:hypothetical protein
MAEIIADVLQGELDVSRHNCRSAKAARAIYAGAWSNRHHDRIVIVVDDRIARDSSLRIFHTGKSKSFE